MRAGMDGGARAGAGQWVTTLVGLAVVVLAVWLVAHNFQPPRPIGHDPSPRPSSSSSAADDGGGLMYALGADAGSVEADAGPMLLTDLLGPDLRFDAGIGGKM